MELNGNLSIGTPCHEDWNKMTPNQKGRYCDSCQKTVVDLRGKEQNEIKEIYVAHEGNLCGNMSLDQYKASREPVRGFNINSLSAKAALRLKVFAAALFAAFSFMFVSPAKGQRPLVKGKIAYHAPTGNLQGFARFENGGLAKEVDLVIYKDGNQVGTCKTNSFGYYSFTELEFGTYYIGSSHGLYYVENEGIDIKKSRTYRENLVLVEEMMMGDIAPIDIEEIEEEVIEAPEILEVEPKVPVDKPQDCEIMMRGEIAPLPEQNAEVEESVNLPTELGVIEPVEIKIDPKEASYLLGAMEIVMTPPEAVEIENTEVTPEAQAEAPFEINGLEIKAFPNPTHSELYIRLESGQIDSPMDVYLFDIDGKQLRTGVLTKENSGGIKLDISNLASGIYILKVLQDNFSSEHKIVKL